MYSFTVTSGQLTISDVAHPKNFLFAVNVPVLDGQWDCRAEIEDCISYGNRVKKLIIKHQNAEEPSEFRDLPELCVDYGVTVICDSDEYEVEEIEAKTCMFETRNNKIYSSTGFGAEVCEVRCNTGLIDYIEVSCFEDLQRVDRLTENVEIEKSEIILTRIVTYYMMGSVMTNVSES